MNRVDIALLRLANQRIVVHKYESPAQVVRELCAVQAQDYPGALWSVALRTHGATHADVEAAIARREIIRTWPMRGTLHFVAPEDVRWMLKLMTPRVLSGAAARERQLELDATVFAKGFAIFEKELANGPVQRKTLLAALDAAGIVTANQRGYHIMWRAAQQGLICLGPMDGKQPTYVLLDNWIPNGRSLSREESLAEIVIRYVTSHGPVRLEDIMNWTKLNKTDIKAGLTMVGQQLVHEEVDGISYWMSANQPRHTPPKNQAALLPGFDEYMLGYRDRSVALPVEHNHKVVPGNNGMFLPTIILDGQVAGLWKRTVRAKEVTIELKPFDTLSPVQLKAIEPAAQAYGAFHGLPARIVTD